MCTHVLNKREKEKKWYYPASMEYVQVSSFLAGMRCAILNTHIAMNTCDANNWVFLCSGPTIFCEEENKKQLNCNDTFRMDDEISTIDVRFKNFDGSGGEIIGDSLMVIFWWQHPYDHGDENRGEGVQGADLSLRCLKTIHLPPSKHCTRQTGEKGSCLHTSYAWIHRI